MDVKNRFLNRLFGFKSNKPTQEAIDETPAKQAPKETPAAVITIDPQLDLADDHALHQLYFLWCKQAHRAPRPLLRLDGPDALSPEETKRELARLQKELTTAAASRLKEATPRPKKDTAGKEEDDKNRQDGDTQAEMPSLDALPFLFISADRMAAWLMVFPPTGQGKELDRSMLDQALEKNRVSFGVDTDLLDRLPNEANRYFRLFFTAKGTPVIHGKDGYIEEFFKRSMQQKFSVDEHDRVDYFNLNLIQNIEKDAVICQAVPPVAGTPGRTVRNEEVPCREGKKAALPKGRNTKVSEDGSQLLAALSGRVEFSGQSFQVKTVMEIEENVDLSTGNIDYMGDVHVRGNVCSGFFVRAVGGVTVDGAVEAAEIESGGDLRVAKGIVGNGHTVIRSRHNIYAKYLENCVVHVRQNLYADYLVNCEIYCDGEVQISTGKGIIIGGHIRSAQGVSAKTVGSRSENHTYVYLGGQPCADFERESLLQKAKELDIEMKKTQRQPAGPAKTKQINKIRLDMSVQNMKLAQFDKDLEQSREKLEQKGGCRMRCDLAYPGLILTINNVTLRLTQETSCLNGRLVDGEIQIL